MRARRWRALAALLALLALSIGSACAGPAASPAASTTAPPVGDRASAGAAAPTAAAGPSATGPVERVRVTVPTKSLTFLPFYFGQSKDLYRAEGIDLELIQMRPPAGITALDAGDVEYSAAPGVGMRAALQGAPLRAIMFAQAKPSFSLLGQPGLPPERIRTVGVSSLRSTAHYAAMAVMRSLGRGGPDDVTYFATNDTANSYQALVAQAADAAILSPPYTTMATLAGYVYLGDAFHMADVQGGLVTTTRRLQEQPAQVKAVLRGTLRSLDYIASHPDEVIDYLQREFELERPVAAGSYDIVKQVLNMSGDLDESTLRLVIDQMKEDAEIAGDVPLDRVVDLSPLRVARSEMK